MHDHYRQTFDIFFLSSSPDGRFTAKVLSLNGNGTEAPVAIDVLKIGEHGVVKVATKDGAVKLGLPCVVEGKGIACCSRKESPEAKKVAVCRRRLGDEVGMPPEAACSSMLIEFACARTRAINHGLQ